MNFSANIVNHANPGVSVTVADSSGVTYQQIKNSLGQHVYLVQGLYLYSENINQLIGVINYSRYDATGNQNITNIVTTVDPYEFGLSINVDLSKTPEPIVINGNNSFSTTILPNTYLEVKFYSKRQTSSFGMNLNNFRDMQRITRTEFFNNYGAPIEEIQAANQQREKTAAILREKKIVDDNGFLVIGSAAALFLIYIASNE